MSGFSFAPAWVGASPALLAKARSFLVALCLISAALASPCQAQAPDLMTAATFGVLAGSTITNTGPSVIDGDIGVSPTVGVPPHITGFPPGTVTGTQYDGGAVALQAQIDNANAYIALASRPATANLTGQDLGGLMLGAGVYAFNTSAQLSGTLVLNAQGNSNAVFIFNIGSTLTTASASRVLLINGALGSNVFWRVGSSATLGTTTSFVGGILALTSITLNTGANITCGAALAQNGAVTLDTNNISLLSLCTAAAAGLDSQLTGELGTGAAVAGILAMNSFLSLMTDPFLSLMRNPFENNSPFAESPARRPMMPVKAPIKALGYGPGRPQSAFASADPFLGTRRWSIWGAAYGGNSNNTGDLSAGTHDRSARTFGYATGIDYLVTPSTMVGFALAGGATNYGLSDGLGSGHSDMFQAAVYGTTRINAAYVSAVLAYGWHRVSTDRYVTFAGNDHLTAKFSAHNVAGRIEGGYRLTIPGVLDAREFGVTPYAAFQAQAYRTPSYNETAVSGSSTFALAYDAHTTTTARTELGSWVDASYTLDRDNVLTLFGRAAWAHDWYSDPSTTASFQTLPGSSFTVIGAAPVPDSALLTAGAKLSMRNGWSVMAKLDGELSRGSRTYIGSGRLRYTW